MYTTYVKPRKHNKLATHLAQKHPAVIDTGLQLGILAFHALAWNFQNLEDYLSPLVFLAIFVIANWKKLGQNFQNIHNIRGDLLIGQVTKYSNAFWEISENPLMSRTVRALSRILTTLRRKTIKRETNSIDGSNGP